MIKIFKGFRPSTPGFIWRWAGLALLVGLGVYYFAGPRKQPTLATTATVRSGPLRIGVLEGGSMEALESQENRSEIKGYQGTKILSIVEEGYLVTEEDVANGKVLVELDSSDLKQRIITEDIQYQSTLSALIEAQQAYDIQYNQNISDIKAAELKATFARMDFEKFLGDTAAREVIGRLDLYEVPFTNDVESVERAINELLSANATASSNLFEPTTTSEPFPNNPVAPRDSGATVPAPGPKGTAPMVETPLLTGSVSPVLPPANAVSNAVDRNLPVNIALDSKPASSIDWSAYADEKKLQDGTAKQLLRKLNDDLLMARQELAVAETHIDGTRQLFKKEYVAKTELDNEQLKVDQAKLKVQTAETALNLNNKYEFVRSSQDFASKFDEALRSLLRAKKEAISKLAQSRAKLKAAEGRWRIESEQRRDLKEQLEKCTIRAQRPGLVVYGGGRDRGFFGEEQIREGVTVRERQPIITIPDMTKMAVKIRIHESQIKKVEKGQKARIKVDAFPNDELEGEVMKVSVLPDSQNRWINPDMKVYVTMISVDGVREWLKPGMSAQVEVLVKELTNVIYVPLQAVMPVGGKQVCFVAHGVSTEKREVEIGEFNDEHIEIKQGLKVGEKVTLRAPDGVEKDNSGPSGASQGTNAPTKKAAKINAKSGVKSPNNPSPKNTPAPSPTPTPASRPRPESPSS